MFGSVILEVAISLVFIYLLLSLICSAVNELIMRIMATRARLFFNAMGGMLMKNVALRDAFFNHPLIRGLETKPLPWYLRVIGGRGFWRGGQEALVNRPAYVPSRTFALVMRQLAKIPDAIPPAGIPDPDGEAGEIAVANAARVLIKGLGMNTTEFQKNLEKWFDDAMEHVTGWFKRKAQTVNLFLALFLAVALNADSFMLAQFLWTNPAVREKIVLAADAEIKRQEAEKKAATKESEKKDAKKAADDKKDDGKKAGKDPGKKPLPDGEKKDAKRPAVDKKDEGPKPPPPAEPNDASPPPAVNKDAGKPAPEDSVKEIKKLQAQLQELGIPVGWKFSDEGKDLWDHVHAFITLKWWDDFFTIKMETPDDVRSVPRYLPAWISKILGLLVTGMAVSLGAPFWFDLLKSLNTLRTTGKPPKRAEEQPAANP